MTSRNIFLVALVAVIGASVIYIAAIQEKRDTSMPETPQNSASGFSLSSPAFAANASIPSKYTCDDPNLVSPPLMISGAPGDTKSYALIVEDPDVPKQLKPDGVFLHWVLFNVPGSAAQIPEGAPGGLSGLNGAGKAEYAGPCPPPQYEPKQHRYVFTLYALNQELSLQKGASKEAVVNAMEGHILGQTQLIGVYARR